MQPTHPEQPTQPMQPTHPAQPTLAMPPTMPAQPMTPMLSATPALPATTLLPATAALPVTAEAPATAEEPTTPDPVELVREQIEALDRGDRDGVMSSVAENVVLEGRALGDLFEGRAAIRGFLEEWFRAYEELDFELEEVSHLGGGVVFAVVIQDGRPVGGDGRLRQREGWVYLWVGGVIARLETSDVDHARAAAERIAEQRG